MKSGKETELFKPEVNEKVHLTIEKITPGGGRGLARHRGFVVFVPDVLAGERVLAQITKVSKRFAEAKLLKVEEASSDRVDPPCPYFSRCGGCTLQMAEVSTQEDIKQGFLKELFNKLNLPLSKLEPLTSSPKSLRYRNRIQLHQEGAKIGYHEKGSHRLVDIEDCLIADESIGSEINRLKNKSKKRRFELILTKTNQVRLRDKRSKNPKDLFFSQVNEGVNQKIKQCIKKKVTNLNGVRPRRVLDLYAGAGNFSEIFNEVFPESKIKAVELSEEAVKRGAELFPEIEFVCEKVETYLQKENQTYDLILLDPPREGLKKVQLHHLLDRKARTLIYISCHLGALERDLKDLMDGFEIDSVHGFDMFPQTDHLETVVFLSKK